MYILIQQDGTLSLEECTEMKSFSIIDKSDNKNRTGLDAIATAAEDNHYWIDAEAVITLSPQGGDQQWKDNFWNMLKAVEPYGYSNLAEKQVKAHVED